MTAQVLIHNAGGQEDVLVERISEPDGEIIGGARLEQDQGVSMSVGHTHSLRISVVAKLSSARKAPA